MQGRIPDVADFAAAMADFDEVLCDLLPEPVIGAIRYGSTVRSDWSLASDIDYFVVIADLSAESPIAEAVQRAWKEYAVTLEVRVLTMEMAQSGRHGVDGPFAAHLASITQFSIGENPVQYIAPTGRDWHEECKLTLERYLRKLTNDQTLLCATEVDDARIIKRILDKPVHAMRVMVQFDRGVGTALSSRAEIVAAYRETSFGSLAALLLPLEKARQQYLQLLQERTDNPAELERYREVQQRMRNCYPAARLFVQENLLRMR
ncbi:MAG TPA: nucleotidyltransferase domain-containing protein [Candidatus Nanoarchaeia archaeon]|nr:nucleotidyltransferase domain-containing protein [Candidatus Nanoarchaeia archaeon]